MNSRGIVGVTAFVMALVTLAIGIRVPSEAYIVGAWLGYTAGFAIASYYHQGNQRIE